MYSTIFESTNQGPFALALVKRVAELLRNVMFAQNALIYTGLIIDCLFFIFRNCMYLLFLHKKGAVIRLDQVLSL